MIFTTILSIIIIWGMVFVSFFFLPKTLKSEEIQSLISVGSWRFKLNISKRKFCKSNNSYQREVKHINKKLHIKITKLKFYPSIIIHYVRTLF